MDMAASIQSVTEKIILKITKNIAQEYEIDNLCMAGGVALNCVANGKILRAEISAYGYSLQWSRRSDRSSTCLLVQEKKFRKNNLNDSMNGSYLESYSDEKIEEELKECGANYKKYTLDEVINNTAEYVSKTTIGWFQGRMEFGPRALGNRSILGNAASPKLKKL